MKNNVIALQGVTVEAGTALAKDITAPVQTVEVRKTLDYKNSPKAGSDSNWQGYMIHFAETSAGVGKVVPISAGRLLAIQQETNVEVFTTDADGALELTNFNMGIEDGNPIF